MLIRVAFLLTLGVTSTAHPANYPRDTWETLASIPGPLQEHSAVALSETTLAVVGGIIPISYKPGYNTSSAVQFYNIPANSWSKITDAPILVNHPNVAAVDDKLYLLGGLTPDSEGIWRAFADSWVLDLATRHWESIPPLPPGEARGSSAVGVYNKTIYLAGGMRTLQPGAPGGEQDTVSHVSKFDTSTSTWEQVSPAAAALPEGRDHAGVAVINNKLYVLGGRTRGQYNVKDTVFILNLDCEDEGWATSNAKMPTSRGGVFSGTVNGKAYIFGGEGNPTKGAKGVFNNVEVFDSTTETWEILDPMPVPRHGGSAVVIGNGVYLTGGGIKEGGAAVDVLDVYRPSR